MKELSLHILDILQNSVEAEATKVDLLIEENKDEGLLKIVIRDNGRGMGPEELKKALDPFYTTRGTRRIGLGLPLFYELSKRCNGKFALKSSRGKGTSVEATFELDHVDLPPMGDIAGTVLAFVIGNPGVDLKYVYRGNYGEFVMDTEELKRLLEVEELGDPVIVEALREKIKDTFSMISSF